MASVFVENERTVSETHQFLWTIPNFLGIRKYPELVEKQKFTFELGTKIGLPSEWAFTLTTKTEDDEDLLESFNDSEDKEPDEKKWIGIYLEQRRISVENIEELPVHWNVRVPGKNRVYLYEELSANHKVDWGYPELIPQTGDISEIALSEDGDLPVFLSVTIFNRNAPPDLTLSVYLSAFSDTWKWNLSRDLSRLLTFPFLTAETSMKIRCRNGHHLRVDKGLIAIRNEVFRALIMVQEEPREELTMEEFSFEVLDLVLHYLHSGTLKPCWKREDILQNLILAADQYQVQDLLEFFNQVLVLLSTPDNCGTLLKLPKRVGMLRAETQLLEKFKNNVTDFDQITRFVTDCLRDGKLKKGRPNRNPVLCQEPQQFALKMRKTVLSDETIAETKRLTLTIPNFARFRKDFGNAEHLPEVPFEMGTSVGAPSKWKVLIRADNIKNKAWLGVYLKDDNRVPGLSKMLVNFGVKIGTKCDQKKFYFCEEKNQEIADYREKIGFAEVIPEKGKISPVELTSSGALEVNVTVTIFNPDCTEKSTPCGLTSVYFRFGDKLLEKLSSDLEKMYTDEGIMASGYPGVRGKEPIKVVSKDGQEFPVKPSILAARSDVFRAMFQQKDMTEVKNGIVRINDICGKPLSVLLHFLHTGVLQDNWNHPEILEELAYAAQKYLVEDLSNFLDQALGFMVTEENFGKLMGLAKRLGMKTAETQLLEWFKKNCSDFEKMKEFVKQANGNWTPATKSKPGAKRRRTENLVKK